MMHILLYGRKIVFWRDLCVYYLFKIDKTNIVFGNLVKNLLVKEENFLIDKYYKLLYIIK